MSIDLELFGKGALHEVDERDYRFGAPMTVPYDWSKPYEHPPIESSNQNGSLSCVGQTAMNMAKISWYLKYGTFDDFSARFIYCQIALQEGGAYMRDGVATLVKMGIPHNTNFPSDPQTEEHMKDKTGLDEVKPHAKKFDIYTGDFAYAAIGRKIDDIAVAIRDHGSVMLGARGSNPGWSTAYPQKPDINNPPVWGHAVCGAAPVLEGGKKYIKFINSWSKNWGGNGYGYFSEDYINSEYFFEAYVLTDNFINPKNMVGYKLQGTPEVYIPVGQKYLWVNSWEAFIELGGAASTIVELTEEQYKKLPVSNKILITKK